jgi:hypothetical protein
VVDSMAAVVAGFTVAEATVAADIAN